tara:strand:+ start:1299 stop:2327 length:1029 start_codon:yes stop_codon:yes gene_type:complete
MNKDYYKTLNINSNSSPDEIKKAFRNLSKTHHPDKGGDENTFKEISAAYDTLSNEQKRREYDHQRSNPFHGRQPHGGGHHRGGGPNMDDLFNQFFNKGGHQRQVKKGRNLNIPLTVSLEDIFFGHTKKLRYSREMKCEICKGTGGNSHTCHVCKGHGHVETVVGNAFFRQVRREACPQCQGTGKIIVQACNECGAKGTITRENTVDFKLPTDLMTGQLYTFRNLGDEIENGAAGDLGIQVVIQPHPHFKVVDADIIYEVKIPILQMLVGTHIEIPFFTGPLSVKIPPLSDLERNFNVRGKGMRAKYGVGDLIIKPQVVMPKKLTSEEQLTLEKLEKKDNFKI